MANWEFFLYGPGTGDTSNAATWDIISSLSGLEEWTLEFKLDDADRMTGTISGYHVDAALFEEARTDIVATRDSVRLFRGRVGPSADELDGTNHRVSVNAFGYRELLKRRLLVAGDSILTYAQTTPRDLEDIGWQLIAATQARAEGNLGIARVGISTGQTATRIYEDGQAVGDNLDQLSNDEPGMEYEIDPYLKYRVYYPRRGDQGKNFALDYGGTVSKVSRTVETADFANTIRATTTVAGVTPTTIGALIGTEGRWELLASNQNWLTNAQQTAGANGLLAQTAVLMPSYTLELAPTVWGGTETLWLGDQVRVLIKSGRLDVDTFTRVLGISIAYSNGTERVTVTTGRPTTLDRYYRIGKRIATRLETLERR